MDIGSTYSGYAWQWRGDFERNRSNIEYNTNWGTAALRVSVDFIGLICVRL